jgi:CheY-like chemotaxis protein
VLVVDDDPDALDLASAILTAAGAEVRTCGAATEALEIMGRWRPDVLVSDIEMPGEDGHALIRKVRALDAARGRKTPAVALTAYGRTQDRVLSLTAGYNMHVPKPVDSGELTPIVANVAGRVPVVSSALTYPTWRSDLSGRVPLKVEQAYVQVPALTSPNLG